MKPQAIYWNWSAIHLIEVQCWLKFVKCDCAFDDFMQSIFLFFVWMLCCTDLPKAIILGYKTVRVATLLVQFSYGHNYETFNSNSNISVVQVITLISTSIFNNCRN